MQTSQKLGDLWLGRHFFDVWSWTSRVLGLRLREIPHIPTTFGAAHSCVATLKMSGDFLFELDILLFTNHHSSKNLKNPPSP